MDISNYHCLKQKHEYNIELPKDACELTLQSVRTQKSDKIWTCRVAEHHATILTIVCAQSRLLFDMSVYEPVLEKLSLEHNLDGQLVDLTVHEDMTLHLLMKYGELHAY